MLRNTNNGSEGEADSPCEALDPRQQHKKIKK
jgi:hypothetical protein